MTEQDDRLREWRTVQSGLNKLFVHDLRNPISAITANLSYLDSSFPDGDEDLRGALTDSLVAVDMLLTLAENLELVGQLEAGEPSSAGDLDLEIFIGNCAKRCASMAASAGVELTLDPLPAGVDCRWPDRQVGLALTNLILNAVRHAPTSSAIRIGAAVVDGEVRISVRDRGAPIPEELRWSIFEREGQVDSRKRSDGRYSRGLGLYVAHLVAKSLGGRTETEGADGLTEFAMILPQIF